MLYALTPQELTILEDALAQMGAREEAQPSPGQSPGKGETAPAGDPGIQEAWRLRDRLLHAPSPTEILVREYRSICEDLGWSILPGEEFSFSGTDCSAGEGHVWLQSELGAGLDTAFRASLPTLPDDAWGAYGCFLGMRHLGGFPRRSSLDLDRYDVQQQILLAKLGEARRCILGKLPGDEKA